MENEHTPFLDNIPAYALGALDAAEAVALEVHLENCDSCREELASYSALRDGLLLAAHPVAPSPRLRRRLQDQLPSRQKSAPQRSVWVPLGWALGVAVVLLLALNLYSISQLRVMQQQQALLSHQLGSAQVALAMLAYPGTQNVPIQAENVAGRLLMDKEQNAGVLVLWDLPTIAGDKTYQMWLISPNGDRTSAGLFRPETGFQFASLSLPQGQSLSDFTGLGVTVEPAGGSPQPTGPRLFMTGF
jgi:anti-sigma-K factor RskA